MKSTISGVPIETALLVLFDEIYQTQSVTRAAEKLDVSQPTVSVWLAKLRRALADPLFVRTAGGMKPTPRAEATIGPVRDALALLRGLAGTASFDASTARRVFRLCMTDASHITLLPRLLAHLRTIAPGVGLAVAPIDASTARALEAGEADLALGFVAGLESGFYEQALYKQDFVCLVSARHPRLRDTLTLRNYREEAHVAVLSSTSYPMINAALKRQKITRRVHLELPGFLGLAAIVSSTDLVATVPRTIGETLARNGELRVVPCPVKLTTFSVKQYWHARYHHDPGHRWLRARCAELFAQRAVVKTSE
jgi:DNA-binding transcriptional LysR family regulator